MIGPDEPRLTAYVVDEVDPETAAAVEESLRASAETRDAADEIRETARLLQEALRSEAAPALRPEQRAAIVQASQRPRRAPRPQVWLGAVAAGLAGPRDPAVARPPGREPEHPCRHGPEPAAPDDPTGGAGRTADDPRRSDADRAR